MWGSHEALVPPAKQAMNYKRDADSKCSYIESIPYVEVVTFQDEEKEKNKISI